VHGFSLRSSLSGTGASLLQRPRYVLAHQRRRVVRARAQGRYYNRGRRRRGAQRVAETDGQIAQPALVADAMDRAAGKARVEFLFAPCEQVDQCNVVEAVAHGEIRLFARLRELVPRTDELAIVAAVHAVADQRPQLGGYAAEMLYRQVRDAAP